MSNGNSLSGLFGAGVALPNTPAAGNTGKAAEKPKSKFWLNVGKKKTFTNAETGVTEERFAYIPLGIPLDNIEPVKEYGAFQVYQNAILVALKKKMATLAPGESVILNLEIELRHVNEEPTMAESYEEIEL